MTADHRHDPFARITAPPGAGEPARARRIRWIGEVAAALLEGRLPGAEARLFVAASLQGWLERGGELVDDHLGVRGPRGSHRSPQAIWRGMQRHADEGRAGTGASIVAAGTDHPEPPTT